jgi:diacylglycerol O-acyltransferase / wax synthase
VHPAACSENVKLAVQEADRLRPADRTVLASDRGPAPMNIAAVLEFDPAADLDPAELTALLAERAARVPRLRQRLHRPRWRAPVWVDDTRYALDRHVTTVPWSEAGDRRALLDLASVAVCRRLPADRPLWRAEMILRPRGSVGALVVILHHVLTDGLGGLAVLAALADRSPSPRARPDPTQPATRPGPGRLRTAASGLRELGLRRNGRPHLVDRTWVNVPTGPRRRAALTEIALEDVVQIAHRAGGTVNDVVVAAVSGAFARVAGARGKPPGEVVVSVPISARRGATATDLGNDTGVRPIAVPAIVDDRARLGAVVELTRAAREVPRASSGLPLGVAFRALAKLGLFRAFVDHQRFVHTFETNLRGPSEPIRLGGVRVAAIVPITATPGNVAVQFAVLSYAGRLGVTVVVDPDVIADPELIAAEVAGCFERLTPR